MSKVRLVTGQKGCRSDTRHMLAGPSKHDRRDTFQGATVSVSPQSIEESVTIEGWVEADDLLRRRCEARSGCHRRRCEQHRISRIGAHGGLRNNPYCRNLTDNEGREKASGEQLCTRVKTLMANQRQHTHGATVSC